MQQLPQLAGFGQVPGSFPAHDAAAAAAAAAQNFGWVWGMVGQGPPGALRGPAAMQHPALQQQHLQHMQGYPHLGHAGVTGCCINANLSAYLQAICNAK